MSADSAHAAPEVFPHPFTQESPRAKSPAATANGHALFVFQSATLPFTACSAAGPVRIEVNVEGVHFAKAAVKPLRLGIVPEVDGASIRFTIERPMDVLLELDDRPALFIFCSGHEQPDVTPGQPRVHYFAAGRVHEAGEIEIGSGETVYIEAGAVLRGCIHARDARGIRIAGQGVLDGSFFKRGKGTARHPILLEHCEDVVIEGITIIDPSRWTCRMDSCRGVRISGLREITRGGGSDGIDVVSCTDVLIERCFLCTGDDAIVIKAIDVHAADGWNTDIDNIVVNGCSLLVMDCGSALEIGHELRTASVRNITFRDCDILAVHGHGAAMSIRAGDRAIVSDVRYENIRVDHYYAHLVDFRVMRSRYNRDPQRGQIRTVHLKNVRVKQSPYNAGYSTSLIGGYNAEHTVEGVVFEDVYLDDEKVMCGDQLDLHVKQAKDIEFR